MIERLLHVIVSKMETEELILSSQKEQYIYALIMLVEKWITIFSIIVISFVCDLFFPTVVFLYSFLALRKRTGGFHADKFWQCYLGTILTYVLLVKLTPFLDENRGMLYSCTICSSIIIAMIGTVNHPNMNMDSLELKECKRSARYMLGLQCIVLFLGIILNVASIYLNYMASAIILCSILLCIAKIIKQEV